MVVPGRWVFSDERGTPLQSEALALRVGAHPLGEQEPGPHQRLLRSAPRTRFHIETLENS